MLEEVGDLWSLPADARIITTNGDTNNKGEAVMGRGCALEAKQKSMGIDRALGHLLKTFGNKPRFLLTPGDVLDDGTPCTLLTFPVKHHWRDKADLDLIKSSANIIEDMITAVFENKKVRVVMPRPGCGNGHLDWANVKPILDPILDDRFIAVHWN